MIMIGSFATYYKICARASGIRLKQLAPGSALRATDKEGWYLLGADFPLSVREFRIGSISKLVNMEDAATSSCANNTSKSQLESLSVSDCHSQMDIFSTLPTEFGKKRKHGHTKKALSVPRNFKYAATTKKPAYSKGSHRQEPFDICLSGSRSSALKASLLARKVEIQNGAQDMVEFIDSAVPASETPIILRPGMVLLKNHVTLSEQVEIVKKCRELGLGPGGFYQPGYQDGAKLRLQMMCLGLNWDPQTRKYEKRTIDGIQPPVIPHEFSLLVKRAIQEAHAHIKEELRVSNVEEILPSMSPNICIANFYTTSGRLGLHQDRDESTESLQEGLPVVSISVGDSADFRYGDQRDIAKAENVVLESGDMLIFGGRSRHIFHGVTSIIPNSAPINLLEETSLCPGRLNLTLRQY